MGQDLANTRSRLEALAGIPAQAVQFHAKRNALLIRIDGDAGDGAAIAQQAQQLESVAPQVQALFAATQAARQAIADLRAQTPVVSDEQARTAIEEWTDEWSQMLGYIEDPALESRAIAATTKQAQTIKEWSRQRQRALGPLVAARELSLVANAQVKPTIEARLRSWTTEFCSGKVDEAWAVKVERELDGLRQRGSGAAKTVPFKGAPAPAPVVEKSRPVTSGQAVMQFHKIALALADCRDMAEALGSRAEQVAELTARQRQLRESDGVTVANVEQLLAAVEAMRKSLADAAQSRRDAAMEKLERRWRWFRELYDRRGDIADMIEKASAIRGDHASPLEEFFKLVEIAEDRIYSVANNNRGKLAAAGHAAILKVRSKIAELRGRCRTLKADAALATIESRIPADPDSQTIARRAFDLLDQCEELQREAGGIDEDITRQQQEILTRAGDLRRIAREIVAITESADDARRIDAIPAEFDTSRSLEEFAGQMESIAKDIEQRRAKVREESAARLGRLRKENLAWVNLVAEFAPEAASLIANDPPPEELAPLRAFLDREVYNRERLNDLAASAAAQVHLRREKSIEKLKGLLSEPAFHSHPDRPLAETLSKELAALGVLATPPPRDEFETMLGALRQCDAFFFRIEHARRMVLEGYEELAGRFRLMRDRNGTIYRPELCRRLNLLLQGVRLGIERQEWEPLGFQIARARELLGALESDAQARFSADVENLAATLKETMQDARDPSYARQIQVALDQLEQEGTSEPPSPQLVRRLNMLAGRTVGTGR